MDSDCFKLDSDCFSLEKEGSQKPAHDPKNIIKRERSFSVMNPLEYKLKVCPKTPVFRPVKPPQDIPTEIFLPPAEDPLPLSLEPIKEEDENGCDEKQIPKSPLSNREFKKPTAKPKERGEARKREDLSKFETLNKRVKFNGNKFGRIRSQSENICDYSIMGFLEKALMRKKSIVIPN